MWRYYFQPPTTPPCSISALSIERSFISIVRKNEYLANGMNEYSGAWRAQAHYQKRCFSRVLALFSPARRKALKRAEQTPSVHEALKNKPCEFLMTLHDVLWNKVFVCKCYKKKQSILFGIHPVRDVLGGDLILLDSVHITVLRFLRRFAVQLCSATLMRLWLHFRCGLHILRAPFCPLIPSWLEQSRWMTGLYLLSLSGADTDRAHSVVLLHFI